MIRKRPHSIRRSGSHVLEIATVEILLDTHPAEPICLHEHQTIDITVHIVDALVIRDVGRPVPRRMGTGKGSGIVVGYLEKDGSVYPEMERKEVSV